MRADNISSTEEKEVSWACLGSECPNTCCGPFHGIDFTNSIVETTELGKIVQGPYDPQVEDFSDKISIFGQIRLTLEDVERLQSGGLDSVIVRRGDPDNPSYYLKLEEDGSCAMLNEDNTCSIYEYRPTVCRAFPFYYDLFAGLCIVKACPGIDQGNTPIDEVREEIEAAKDMYKFWLGLKD